MQKVHFWRRAQCRHEKTPSECRIMVKEIHFVTGKGGVGKSLIAAGLAYSKSQQGLKTLLVELGEQSYFSHFFRLSKVGYEAIPLNDNLELARWSGADSLKEYARHLLKIEALYRLFFENRVSRNLINVAPALTELAILGKITSDPRKQGPPVNFDVIVVDAFATGHFLGLLRGPRSMAKAMDLGPMGQQSREIDEILLRRNLCRYHLVCLPEELPVQETLELRDQLQREFGIDCHLILNKVIRTTLSLEDLKKIKVHPESAAFIEFLGVQINRTQKALAELNQPLQIPFFSEPDPWKLTALVAKEFR